MPYITPPRSGGRTSKVYSLFRPKQNNNPGMEKKKKTRWKNKAEDDVHTHSSTQTLL
jgi:hypothetical protein